MRRGARGLTLVEVCVTVAIIALAAAVVLPAIGNVSRADLRKASSAVSSKVRECYDNAALTGLTWRMVFVLPPPRKGASTFKLLNAPEDDDDEESAGVDGVKKKKRKPGIYLESTERTMAFDSKTGAFAAAASAADILASLDPPPGEEKHKSKSKDKGKEDSDSSSSGDVSGVDVLSGLFSMSKLAAKAGAKAGFKPEGQVPLGDNVRVLDVWTEGMDQAATDGEVSMLFFPNGYTQEALIHLEDTEHRVMTVSVSPLTGKCRISPGYVDPPK